MAANGIEEPPLPQKVYWCVTEGLAAIALLWSATCENAEKVACPINTALNAVKPLPIVLGLPFTFVLFWVSQSALILCREETGLCSINRKNFKVFISNFELASFVSIIFPIPYFGKVAAKTWGGFAVKYMVGFGVIWFAMIVLILLIAVDPAFGYMGACMYVLAALILAGLRASMRDKLGITGDFISDCVTCVFAFPDAMGQMTKELEFWEEASEPGKVIGNVGAI